MIGTEQEVPMVRRLPAICVALAASSLLCAQTLEVVPKRVMIDESATIRAAGLQPNEHVAIRAELSDGGGVHWSSQAEFIADAQGAIDTSKQAPAGGSYKEVSAMGLEWSMMPASHKAARYQPARDLGVQDVDFHLLRGKSEVASARLEQVSMAEGVERVTVHEAGLHGVLFAPPGPGRHPGMLVLGGSEGGLPSRRAAWLASHGFAALALAYFRYENLPQELANIPLEYFGAALQWMTRQPGIDGAHIGIMGTSRGAELTLQLGSMYPVKAVVAYSPANVRYPACCGFTSVPYAWTWQGNPLAFRPVRGARGDEEMRAAIAVERIQGPVLLICGGADRVWDSCPMAGAITARLERAHFTYKVEQLTYKHAGHAAGRPEIVPSWQGTEVHPVSGRTMEMGGSPPGNIESSLDAIPKVIEFLQRSLSSQ
jgi:dienelactone hydrolase